jgi:hypothetical protein
MGDDTNALEQVAEAVEESALTDEDVSEETRVTAKVVVGTYLWRGNIGRHRNHRLAPKKSLAGR